MPKEFKTQLQVYPAIERSHRDQWKEERGQTRLGTNKNEISSRHQARHARQKQKHESNIHTLTMRMCFRTCKELHHSITPENIPYQMVENAHQWARIRTSLPLPSFIPSKTSDLRCNNSKHEEYGHKQLFGVTLKEIHQETAVGSSTSQVWVGFGTVVHDPVPGFPSRLPNTIFVWIYVYTYSGPLSCMHHKLRSIDISIGESKFKYHPRLQTRMVSLFYLAEKRKECCVELLVTDVFVHELAGILVKIHVEK